MVKIRVYELAKELGMNNKDLVERLQQMDISVKNHMSSLNDQQVKYAKNNIKSLIAAEEKKEAGAKDSPTQIEQVKVEKKPEQSQVANKAKAEVKPTANPTQPSQPNNAKPPAKPTNQPPQKKNKRQRGGNKGGKHQERETAKLETPSSIEIPEKITVQEFANMLNKSSGEIIKILMGLGNMATINHEIDSEIATIVAEEFGVEVKVVLSLPIEEVEMEQEENPEDLQDRPPVVTVMGHVDHGKTSLLDKIRRSDVTAKEAGGITQHIGAYQVVHNDKKITFLDTPGHEAFTSMRARGANATDIAILVVAADDGVMPQTVEAINHAKAAKVPLIVAINKVDKPAANVEKVKQELTEYGLVAEEWGGETICVNVSAKTGEGLDDLLEMILLVAEMEEFKANPDRKALGIVIEAELDKGRGPVATVLVHKGTLHVGDVAVAGWAFGKVRAMIDHSGKRVKKAEPSMAVEMLGLSDVPLAGDIFLAVADEKTARSIVHKKIQRKKEEQQQQLSKVSLDDLFKNIDDGKIKDLNIIIKGDVQGSVEAIKQSLEKLTHPEVRINIIHSGVGTISETDVMLAAASSAFVIGFNVRPDSNTRKAAEKENIDIRLYRVIYDAIEDVKAAMSGMLDPDIKEVITGKAEVRQIFKVPKIGSIAGCYVVEGKITSSCKVRVIRNGIVIHEGELDTLKRFKDDVREVAQGYECGIGVDNYNDVKEGDFIEGFILEEVKRQL